MAATVRVILTVLTTRRSTETIVHYCDLCLFVYYCCRVAILRLTLFHAHDALCDVGYRRYILFFSVNTV